MVTYVLPGLLMLFDIFSPIYKLLTVTVRPPRVALVATKATGPGPLLHINVSVIQFWLVWLVWLVEERGSGRG